ncbi:MAG: hemolysin family protein [Phycisphaerae bacterium]
MEIALVLLWSALTVLFGTAVTAIRLASRTRLTEILKDRNLEDRLDRLFKHQGDYARAALAYQFICTVLFILTIDAIVGDTNPAYLRPAYILAITLPWIVLFGVGIPTAWARHTGDVFLARLLPILDIIRIGSRPLLAIIAATDEIVRRLAGAPREMENNSEQIELEIMDAVIHGETSGAVDPSEKAMIKSVMVLDETSVGEIMTPRTDMTGIEVGADFDQARDLVVRDGHSRIPVYEGSMDHVVGILYAKDLLGVTDPGAFRLRKLMRDATFVPETKDLASLLREFQANRVHIAIVLDEYGGTAGLVTFEDILEELVGEIVDEHEAPPTPPIRRIDDKTADIDARVRVEELNEALAISLPEDEDYDTIGGFVFSKLGRIPTVGESLVEGNVRIKVLEAQQRSIHRLGIHLIDPTQ